MMVLARYKTSKPHFGLLLLLVALVAVVERTSATEEATNKAEECIVQEDGSCLDSSSTDTVANTIPALPLVDAEHYMDTGFGEKQIVDGAQADDTLERLQKMHEYMHIQVLTDPEFKDVATECQLRHEQCAFWAGECVVY